MVFAKFFVLFYPNILFKPYLSSVAIIDRGKSYTYAELIDVIDEKIRILKSNFNTPFPVILQGDFSISGIAWLLALLTENYVVFLQTSTTEFTLDEWCNVGIKATILAEKDELISVESTSTSPSIEALLQDHQGGILLLSSGSTGTPKLILHASSRLLNKYAQSKKPYTTLGFLLFDHIAGFDTLMYTLHAGGTLITLPNRQTDTVIQHLIDYNVEVLPTTPSYINLLLLDNQFYPSTLPDLKIITFGSERMNNVTLNRLLDRFNEKVRCEQKYGLTELGSLVLKSKPNDPAWIQLDNRFSTWKVIDNQLHIKTGSSLLAYIYPDHEEICDEWFNTGDEVEIDGDWIKILGRNSDIINVGGQKVYPAEVEAVLQSMPNVLQVVVSGMSHPLMGQVVKASFQVGEIIDEAAFRSSMRLFCKDKLASYKVPVVIALSTESIVSARFKAQRK